MWFMFALCVFFFKQKTAYEMRISDWSSDVCSSDLPELRRVLHSDFVLAGRASGLTPGQNLWRHLLPNVAPVFIVQLSWGMARSEERRVGQVCVSTSSCRWSRYH